jgi:hypothetical protein
MDKPTLTLNRIMQDIDFVERTVKQNGDDGILTGEDTRNMLNALRRIRTETSILSLAWK